MFCNRFLAVVGPFDWLWSLRRLTVGSYVRLSPDYARHPGAATGPLKPGDTGILIEDNHSSTPFRVLVTTSSSDPRTHRYEEAAFVEAAVSLVCAPVCFRLDWLVLQAPVEAAS